MQSRWAVTFLAASLLSGCGRSDLLDDGWPDASADVYVHGRPPAHGVDSGAPADAGVDRTAPARSPDSGVDAAKDAGADRRAPPSDARTDVYDADEESDATGSSHREVPDACAPAICVPLTCANIDGGVGIGDAPDGCGNVLDCGDCGCLAQGVPQSCWGAVTIPPGVWWNEDCCGMTCLPKTCAELGVYCATAGDGCGNVLECGSCIPGGTCPMPPGEQCPGCPPTTCAALGSNCGTQSDGCGGVLDCGSCDPCIPCLGGVCAGVLVSLCVPKTCADLGRECGAALDGCDNPLDCGSCPASLTCSKGRCLPVCE